MYGKYFLLFPQKNLPPENLQLYQKKTFGTLQFDKISVLVNFVIWKLKSERLVCLSSLWWEVVVLRKREKIFCTYTYRGRPWESRSLLEMYSNVTLRDGSIDGAEF